MTTLRGIPIDGERPVITRRDLLRLLNAEVPTYRRLMDSVHWPFPEQAGPALCGMPLIVGVAFAGLTDPGAVTCPDCLEWMRS